MELLATARYTPWHDAALDIRGHDWVYVPEDGDAKVITEQISMHVRTTRTPRGIDPIGVMTDLVNFTRNLRAAEGHLLVSTYRGSQGVNPLAANITARKLHPGAIGPELSSWPLMRTEHLGPVHYRANRAGDANWLNIRQLLGEDRLLAIDLYYPVDDTGEGFRHRLNTLIDRIHPCRQANKLSRDPQRSQYLLGIGEVESGR